jgi:hypothetical protein
VPNSARRQRPDWATQGALSAQAWQNHPAASPPPSAPTRCPAGGYVVRDANGQALAHVYSRDNEAEARQAKMLTKDEAKRIAINVRGAAGPGEVRVD